MDLACYYDLNLMGREVSDPLEELAQDVYHRLIETPGSNIDDPDRGLGLEDALSGPYDPTLGARIEAELRKDDRIGGVSATVLLVEDGHYEIAIEIEVDGSTIGVVFESDAAGGVRRVS